MAPRRRYWMPPAVCFLVYSLGLSCDVSTAPGIPEYIWWEAETPRATSFPAPEQNPFRPQNPQEASVLSNGRWVGVGGEGGRPLFLEYDVAVPRAGRYELYARKFWQHGPFRWRFDGQPWQEVGRDVALLDEAPMRPLLVANWVDAGAAQLAPGKHTLRIELLGDRGPAAFDAFVLTPRPFLPRGKLKPGERYNRAPDGWFPFEPDIDPFAESPIDLRGLNERFAGEHGFIRVKDGEFVHGETGKPVRFWAVNAGGGMVNLSPASVDTLARSLAKLGVNMVRVHGPLWGADFRRVDPAHLQKLFYFISAMRKQGIYTALSIYFPLWLRLSENSGFAGYTGQNPFALLFFNPEFQAIYRGWWKTALTTPNPYTGKPLNQDPAVALVELVNEDSYLFWTFKPYDTIPGPQMALLEKQFGDWLAGRHGSVEKALRAWGGKPVRGDEAAAGRAGFMNLYDLFTTRSPRAQETATFLTQNQERFFAETTAYLKKDLGFKGSIYGSNWITANAAILGPLDKYSNTVADSIDRHGYFDPPHLGERASYSLNKGDRYEDRSALLFQPRKEGEAPEYSLPIMDIRTNGMPSTITEINWPMPNRYRADLPLLAAAYGSLQNSSGFFFFALSGPFWQGVHTKFGIQTPVVMGQFPAAALIYRKRLVKPGATVVDAHLKLSDLYALKGAPIAAPVNLEELRARDIPPGKSVAVASVERIDPLSTLVGKVSMRISREGGPSRIADLSRFIDRDRKTVRSQTEELFWDYGKGLVTLNAPQAQGATGFLAKASAIDLRDVTIDGGIEYGAVTVVSLDGKPLGESRRMLLQVISEDANDGWEAPGAGLREIRSIGGAPIVVKKLRGTVSFKRADAGRLKVTALDFNGYPLRRMGSARRITLQESTLYYLIAAGALTRH